MLQAVKLPASVANLATGLANVDGNALTHVEEETREVLEFLFENLFQVVLPTTS